MGAASIDDTAYFGAGIFQQPPNERSVVFAYHSVTRSWTNYSNALIPARYDAKAIAIGRKVIFAGGYDGSAYVSASDTLNVDTGAWTHTANVLSAERSPRLACTNAARTKGIFWGGSNATGAVQNVDLYDGSAWSRVPLPANYVPREFRGSGGGTAGSDKCVFISGMDMTETPIATADIYTFSTGVMQSGVVGLSAPRWYFATASSGSRLYIAGGQTVSPQAVIASVEYYDSDTNSWGVLPVSLSSARAVLSGVATPYGGLVFWMGGSGAMYYDTVDMYNISSGAMTLSRPLTGGGCFLVTPAVAGTQILIAGGNDDHKNPYPYVNIYESSYCAGLNPSPCANGGTCVSGLTGYSCACANGWAGAGCAVRTTSTALPEPGSTAAAAGTGAGTGVAAAHPSNAVTGVVFAATAAAAAVLFFAAV